MRSKDHPQGKWGTVMKKQWLISGTLLVLLSVFLCVSLGFAEAKWPADPGKNLKKNGKLQLDVSNASEGYFLARISKSSKKRMKLRVKKGKEMLTYDLNGKAEFEVFPLQLGDGKYEILLYEQVSGKKYSSAGKIGISVKLSDPEVSFLYPNQYVNYTPETEPVGKADELCKGLIGNDAYETVRKFMSTNFHYDFVKALTIKAGVLPDIEGSYDKRMGVCQDLSAITCCMLRTQGVPARLVIGYADTSYHAWVEFNYEGKKYFFDPTAAVNGISRVSEYSVERFY